MREPNGKAHEANSHTATASPNDKAPLPAATVATVSNGEPAAPPEGRTPGGHFAAGNKFAHGNPTARKAARLRQVLLEEVTEDRLRAVVRKLLEQAEQGDLSATKILLSYALGRPAPVVDPDRLDLDEWQLLNANPTRAEVLLALLDLIRSDEATKVLVQMMNCETPQASHNRLFGKEPGGQVPASYGRDLSQAKEDRRHRARKK
jgi:hypothetical protein